MGREDFITIAATPASLGHFRDERGRLTCKTAQSFGMMVARPKMSIVVGALQLLLSYWLCQCRQFRWVGAKGAYPTKHMLWVAYDWIGAADTVLLGHVCWCCRQGSGGGMMARWFPEAKSKKGELGSRKVTLFPLFDISQIPPLIEIFGFRPESFVL